VLIRVLHAAPIREQHREHLSNLLGPRPLTPHTYAELQYLMKSVTGKKQRLKTDLQYFMLPADRIWKDLPADYYTKVKRPMDLSTVGQRLGEKLDNSLYATHSEFHADVMLIFQNAIDYNKGSTHPEQQKICAAAERMILEFQVIWAETCIRMWDASERHEIDSSIDEKKQIQSLKQREEYNA
jgi:hypothetical protein